ncbi:hypothetical protein EAG14_08230 [Acidovorax sp. 1608163]|uniref:hypothetical protein n=1 Tax=Acidovorax sp. 1608163 TaxID=2478662 RepID=UPI000EF7083A|nr:hypothetical protein [Acidovorax sp. 1608163]AYM96072.1 hypothetical protein EAG14_08230 [Acidovorax sp. 1608163]
MSARAVDDHSMNPEPLDFTPEQGEALSVADVERCFKATDFADRALHAAIDAACNLMEQVSQESRPALIAAHMQASALTYLAERLAWARLPASAPENTNDA